MALYYRFKCAKQFTLFPMTERYISVGEFKDRIFETKIGRGRDFDLVITNAETNEDYIDESELILANTSLLIRRIPGWPRKPIVLGSPVKDEPKLKEKPYSAQDTVKPSVFIHDSAEWEEFFASNSLSSSSTVTTVDDEKSKIQALVNKPAPEWQQETRKRMSGRNIPPEGYVCHRCKVAGHFIQHCPTNGDPDYDVKKFKAPTGIPKSMLVATRDGFYELPGGKVAVLRPHEATFEKEIEGMPSTQRSVADIPQELYCKMCKKIMEYAVMTSKCCFDSFCDQCIRNYIISNSMCVCGAKNILADHLLPNLTLRIAINRRMESNNSSVEINDETALQIQNTDFLNPQTKVPSPGRSLDSNNEAKVPSPAQSVASNKEEGVVASKQVEVAVTSTKEEESEAAKNEEGEATNEPLGDGEMQWTAAQYIAAQTYMTSMAFAAYNPYWNWTASLRPGMEGFVTSDPYVDLFPYMSSGVGPMDMSSGGVLPQKLCSGPPKMSRSGEFEASKAAPKRKLESLKEHDREVYRADISSRTRRVRCT